MLDRQVKETNVSFSTLERVLSHHPSFDGTMWTKLFSEYSQSNRRAVAYVVRSLGNQEVCKAVADTLAQMRKRLER
jgi:hypothetical protein